MKQNASQVLLWLYPIDFNTNNLMAQRLVEVDELKTVLPEVNETSLRSLLFLLTKKALIKTLNIKSKKHLFITKEGISQLEDQFPALKLAKQTIAHWRVLVFLEPPKADQNFRYLRRFLLDKKYIQLSRGVYLSALALDLQTNSLLERIYKGSVVLFETEKILLSDAVQVIGSKINLSDTMAVLSGISREIDGLTALKSNKKRFMGEYKKQIASIFGRLFNVVSDGYCLEQCFFTQASSTSDLLTKLKKIFEI